MTSQKAINLLKASGFTVLRHGKGDHVILQKGTERIVIPGGKQEISAGMQGRVRSAMRRCAG